MNKIGLFLVFYHNCSWLPSDKFVIPCLFLRNTENTYGWVPYHIQPPIQHPSIGIFPYCVNKQGITNSIKELQGNTVVCNIALILYSPTQSRCAWRYSSIIMQQYKSGCKMISPSKMQKPKVKVVLIKALYTPIGVFHWHMDKIFFYFPIKKL